MKQSIRVGVIGMGWMGQVHSRAYNQVRDRFYESGVVPRLVICSDTVEARAREAQERFGFARDHRLARGDCPSGRGGGEHRGS